MEPFPESAWAAAFEWAARRAVRTSDNEDDGFESHPDDEFYDSLRALTDQQYERRLTTLAARSSTVGGGPYSRYETEPPYRPRRSQPPTSASPTPDPRAQAGGRDGLQELDPADYIERLTGRETTRATIYCPLPDHDDNTPSCSVYGPGRGWYCHGCSRGGTVYELAAYLWGYAVPLRGEEFKTVRRELSRIFAVGA